MCPRTKAVSLSVEMNPSGKKKCQVHFTQLDRELRFVLLLPGQILVNRHMQLVDDPVPEGSVFSIGDCSFIQDLPLPSTAQVAEREGRYLAKLLTHSDIRQAAPFAFSSMGKAFIQYLHCCRHFP